MIRHSLILAAALAVFAGLGFSSAQAQSGYVIFDLGTFGGTSSSGTALSANGFVTGYSFLLDDQFQNTFLAAADGMPQNLGTLGGSNSYGYSVNVSGRVAGASQVAGDVAFHAFLSYGNGGSLRDLGTLGGLNSYAYGVNAAGRVVGYSQTAANLAHPRFHQRCERRRVAESGHIAGGHEQLRFRAQRQWAGGRLFRDRERV